VQNPVPAGTFVEVRLQQQSTTVIHQVAQRRVQVLLRPIDQLGAVFRIQIGQRCKMVSDVFGAPVPDLGIGKYSSDLAQRGNLTVVETTLCKSRNTEPGVWPRYWGGCRKEMVLPAAIHSGSPAARNPAILCSNDCSEMCRLCGHARN
jgi:hypothetical protein